MHHHPAPEATLRLAPNRRRTVVALVAAGAVLAGLAAAAVLLLSGDGFTDVAEGYQEAWPSNVASCCESLTVELATDGRPLGAAEATAFRGLLDDFGFSDATLGRIEQTRPLDGQLSAEGELATVWWTYHPDSGLNVVFEPAG